ncbi:MAG: dihydroorotase [Actinomycetota bacterium]|nr:dihydroorotase [Actinomycetota bacterium]MDA3018895.1 dihydroorotase [Actinomycetota bacterium]
MREEQTINIRGGRILDETTDAQGRQADVHISGGVIAEVVQAGLKLPKADFDLDATGCIVSPGFVDLHVHLREPGREESETIETGSRAAALGGFTAVVAMPNTEPSQDSRIVVEFVRAQGERAGLCEVIPSGCITVGRAGEALAPYSELRDAGVTLFTDDGNGVQDPLLMRRALEYARDLDITLAQHCEVSSLTVGAVMHEGSCCSHLGLPGWPALAEELMVHRDIELVRLTGSRIHFLHLSTERSVEMVRRAKAEGLPVTAEATPHHFTLTDEALRSFDPVFKVNPPLRTPADIAALKEGLRDGTIDAIATDHAPHASHLKEQPLDQAPPGMLGLETALALSLSELDMEIQAVLAALSWNPARIAGIGDRHGRPIAVGEPANIAIFDPTSEWVVDREVVASKSKNTPYHGHKVRGQVRHTIFAGQLVVRDGVAQR